jgi:hypothetical protein
MAKRTAKLYVKNEVAEVVLQQSKKRYSYGTNDKLPNELITAIADSGTATTCVSRLKSFIQGNGFAEESAKDFKVNPRQSADDLLSEIAPSSGIFEGFALRVLYRADGSVGSVYKVGLRHLRAMEDGRWRYNWRMGERGYKEAEDIYFRSFTPNVQPGERAKIIAEEIAQHKEQLGEIMVVFQPKEIQFGDIYPIPDCYSGLEDIQTDAALQRQDKRNVKKGFKANVIIAMPGEVDDQTQDEDGKTDQDYLDETLLNFTKEDGNSIALLQGKSKDSLPEITPFPAADILNGTSGARDRVPRFVCRHFSVPPVLVGLEVAAILGNSQAIVNSLKMFVHIVNDRQRIIERAFAKLWPAMDWAIAKLNVYDYLDPQIAAKLSSDEIRAIGGYAPIESKTPSEQEAILSAINALSPLVANKVLESMSEEEIRLLVGLKGKKGVEGGNDN